MDFLNKKSLFFLLAITLFICSSYATNLPKAQIRDGELVDVDVFGNWGKGFIQKLGQFLKEPKGRSALKDFEFAMRLGGAGYELVTYVCIDHYECKPPPSQSTFCKAYCVYQVAKKTAKVHSCEKKCNNQPSPNCVYKSNRLSCR